LLAVTQYQHWMRQAIAQAQEALPADVPVGCLWLPHQASSAIPILACNAREKDCDPLGHAELLLLRKAATATANWRLTNSVLVVTLEPCPMCASAIAQARIGTLVFGAYDPLQGACGSVYNLTNVPWLTVIGGVLQNECELQLKTFFATARSHSVDRATP
jgi:tRNA(adenine34) deaminase